jgi:hypothetical protein
MSFSMVGKHEIIAFVKIVMFANCLNMRKINKYSRLFNNWLVFTSSKTKFKSILVFINLYNNQNQLVLIKMIITKQHGFILGIYYIKANMVVSVFLSDVTSPDVTDSREKRNQGQSDFLRQKIW